MKKIIIIAKILITFLFCQDIYIINNLIEKEGTFYNYMSDKPISGKLYFNYEISKNNFKRLFVGNLENGINVFVKQTKNNINSFEFAAQSIGGYSRASLDEYHSAMATDDLINYWMGFGWI